MDARRRLSGGLRAIRELVAWCARRRRLFRVEGESMLPTLEPGDCVLATTGGGGSCPVGSMMVVREPRDGMLLVKRLASRGERSVSVTSDNPLEARDSRHFGSLGADDVIGTVTLILTRAGRVRLPGLHVARGLAATTPP